jgi:hypothetical protein
VLVDDVLEERFDHPLVRFYARTALPDAAASWARCPGAAVAAFAAAPATPRAAAARAAVTATRCNFPMTISFVLDPRIVDLTIHVNVKP